MTKVPVKKLQKFIGSLLTKHTDLDDEERRQWTVVIVLIIFVLCCCCAMCGSGKKKRKRRKMKKNRYIQNAYPQAPVILVQQPPPRF